MNKKMNSDEAGAQFVRKTYNYRKKCHMKFCYQLIIITTKFNENKQQTTSPFNDLKFDSFTVAASFATYFNGVFHLFVLLVGLNLLKCLKQRTINKPKWLMLNCARPDNNSKAARVMWTSDFQRLLLVTTSLLHKRCVNCTNRPCTVGSGKQTNTHLKQNVQNG